MNKTQNYLELSRNLMTKYKNKQLNIYGRKFRDNDITKMNFLRQIKNPCSDELGPLLEYKYQFVDYDKISNMVKEQFYNPKVMETMSCLVMSGLHNEQSYMDLLKDIQIIDLGKNKPDMIVFFSNLLNGKNKVLTFKYDGDDILNETIIGLIMNLFRGVIPTFTWTYGLTQCNLPLLIKEKDKVKMVSACNEKVTIGKQQYVGLITEYIDGPTLQNYFASPGMTVKRFRSTMLTIFYSIKYANEKLKYVHWDLHDSNVLMRRLYSKDNYIYLIYDNKYLYVGDHLATIIDFGFNSLVKGNKSNKTYTQIANYSRPDLGINPDASYSTKNDILKLLNYTYINMKSKMGIRKSKSNLTFEEESARLIFQEVKDMLMKFTGITNEVKLDIFHKTITENYGIFPNTIGGKTIDDFIQVSLDDLIEYLISLDPTLIVSERPTKVLSCDESIGGNCWSEKEIIDALFTRRDILNLTDLKGYSELLLNKENEEDTIKVFESIQQYLDQIFTRIEKVLNKPETIDLPMMLLMNELRRIDSDLIQLYQISSQLNLPEFRKQISKMKTQVIRLIKKYQDYGLMSLDRNEIMNVIKVPISQKKHWLDMLKEEFRNMKSKYEVRPYIQSESVKRKLHQSPQSSPKKIKTQNVEDITTKSKEESVSNTIINQEQPNLSKSKKKIVAQRRTSEQRKK